MDKIQTGTDTKLPRPSKTITVQWTANDRSDKSTKYTTQ